MNTDFKYILTANTSWSLLRFRENLLRHLCRNGIELVCATPDAPDFRNIPNDLSLKWRTIPLRARGVNPIGDLITFISYIRLFMRERPDLIISYTIKPNIYAGLAARILRLNFIAVTTGLGHAFTKPGFIAWLARSLYSIALHRASAVLFLNEADRQTFLSYGLVELEKTDLLPGEGIDLNLYTPKPRISNANGCSFLLAARMLREKGVELFADAARAVKKEHPSAKFFLAGPIDISSPSGITAESIQKWESEGILTYLGNLPDIQEAMNHADCVVLPTYYREGLPRVLLEAAALERPIITTNTIGCQDIVIHRETGILVNPQSTDSLILGMLEICSMNEGERSRLGRQAREWVTQRFSDQAVLSKYNELLMNLGFHVLQPATTKTSRLQSKSTPGEATVAE